MEGWSLKSESREISVMGKLSTAAQHVGAECRSSAGWSAAPTFGSAAWPCGIMPVEVKKSTKLKWKFLCMMLCLKQKKKKSIENSASGAAPMAVHSHAVFPTLSGWCGCLVHPSVQSSINIPSERTIWEEMKPALETPKAPGRRHLLPSPWAKGRRTGWWFSHKATGSAPSWQLVSVPNFPKLWVCNVLLFKHSQNTLGWWKPYRELSVLTKPIKDAVPLGTPPCTPLPFPLFNPSPAPGVFPHCLQPLTSLTAHYQRPQLYFSLLKTTRDRKEREKEKKKRKIRKNGSSSCN